MKITKREMVETTIDAKYLQVNANVRYWEDSSINGEEDIEGLLIPCRENDNWSPLIELDTGRITNWRKGTEAIIHYKVCDAGTYTFLDAESKEVFRLENCYVPRILCPKDNGYGDYIIMDVDKNGIINEWVAEDLFLDEE